MSQMHLIRCPQCGTNNRVPQEKIERGLMPVCGRCKAALSVEDKPVIVTDATFSAEVEQSSLPVVVDLWAPWCGPCRMIAPTIDELASQMAGRVRFAKLNVDENPRTSARFRVEGIPTLLIFKGGREIDRIVGVQSKSALARRLQQLLPEAVSA